MRRVLGGALKGALALACVACSGGDQNHPSGGTDYTSSLPPKKDAASSTEGGGETPCAPFEKRECSIDLGIVNGVHNCTQGIQICENGDWSECLPMQQL